MENKLRSSFLFHLAVVIAICVLLYVLFFVTLTHITAHGKEVKMPNVTGKDMNTVLTQLHSLHFSVAVDSTYDPTQKPFTVLKQLPDTGSMVKDGRIVMLTVNMVTPPQIPTPNLVGMSYLSAEMLLRNNKLVLGDTSWKPDINSNAILEQRYNGHPINPGDMIQQGGKISLVLGDGAGNTDHEMPGVTTLSVDAARTILSQYHLRIGLILKDPAKSIADTSEASVFDQQPEEKNDAGIKNKVKDGDSVTLIIQ